MSIIINLDVIMEKRKTNSTELSAKLGITMAKFSILKKNKAKALRFSTLINICNVLGCKPGDILKYVED